MHRRPVPRLTRRRLTRLLSTPRARTAAATAGFELLGAPLVFAPTPRGFGLSVVLRSGDPTALALRVRDEELSAWSVLGPPLSPAVDIAQWTVDGLAPGRRYVYEVSAPGAAGDGRARPAGSLTPLFSTRGAPPRPRRRGRRSPSPSSPTRTSSRAIRFRRATPSSTTSTGTMETTLLAVTAEVAAAKPDFVINLGDMLDYHLFGFNVPPPDAAWARLGYLNYRRLLGDTVGHAAHFPVIGNWDGESGCNTPDEIARSMSQRLLYAPGPGPDTYPEGGSANGDYYAFTWGDALFVVLNVMTYTPTCHLLGSGSGVADDWTLGATQLAWLDQTLAQATSKWRFLFIHHTVGGAAGDPDDTAYGRGGGQAAHVGEQATIHAMMLQYGVQVFFYAHDHVFTDMVVDGIHYLLPGSAGAPWKFDSSETGYAHYWPDSGYARVSGGAGSRGGRFGLRRRRRAGGAHAALGGRGEGEDEQDLDSPGLVRSSGLGRARLRFEQRLRGNRGGAPAAERPAPGGPSSQRRSAPERAAAPSPGPPR